MSPQHCCVFTFVHGRSAPPFSPIEGFSAGGIDFRCRECCRFCSEQLSDLSWSSHERPQDADSEAAFALIAPIVTLTHSSSWSQGSRT
jgi:hypothetical protein